MFSSPSTKATITGFCLGHSTPNLPAWLRRSKRSSRSACSQPNENRLDGDLRPSTEGDLHLERLRLSMSEDFMNESQYWEEMAGIG